MLFLGYLSMLLDSVPIVLVLLFAASHDFYHQWNNIFVDNIVIQLCGTNINSMGGGLDCN